MNKKGFVLLESIVVLVVVALSLSVLMSSFSLISRKTKEKEYYDRSSDKYLLYALMNLGTDDTCNYWERNTECTGSGSLNFIADQDNCTRTTVGHILGGNCGEVFSRYGVTHLYVIEDIRVALDAANSGKYNNGTIEYLKTLKKCADCDYSTRNPVCDYPIPYMIGEFSRNGQTYYSSVTFTDLPSNACCQANAYDTPLSDNYESCKQIYVHH